MGFEEAYNDFMREVWPEVKMFFTEAWTYCTGIWEQIPNSFQTILTVVFYIASFGIAVSLVKSIINNYKSWKPDPDSKLMFSYFCGTGNYQRKLIYRNAKDLLYDRKWSWISAAGLAYRLGNCTNESKIILWLSSLLYLPLAFLGIIEMAIRVTLGFCFFFCLNIAIWSVLLVLGIVTRLFIPIFRIIDRTLRVEQHCPHCYTAFRLPYFRCPHCGEVHKNLIPGHCGILAAKCSCGYFIPSSVLSHRSKLVGVCPNPKCEMDLATANAKQFFIQIIGGNSSGKTAFSAAFQHQYLSLSQGNDVYSVSGEPRETFETLKYMYRNGVTESSSASEIGTYNYVHQLRGTAAHSLIFYDIPDEVLLSNEYEKSPLNFGYTDGIIIIIDPLSVASIRNECVRQGEISTTSVFSTDNCEAIIVDFINKFSEIAGRSARKMSDIPVAVLIAKSDIKRIKSSIGMPRIKAQYKKSPENYNNDLSIARDEICRAFLNDNGLANVVNNLESVFSEVRYFPMSAVGHSPEAGIAFEPFGVIDPVAWIAKKRQSAVYPTLKYVQEKLNRCDSAEQG
ncbi:hypothetical protein [Clostridium sp.]